MKTFQMPGVDAEVPVVVLGLMRIATLSDDEIRQLVSSALDVGIDFFDQADRYGRTTHECERRFSEAMQFTSSERDGVTIQTKAGIIREGPYYDLSYEHIVSSVEGSLRALSTDRIDLLLLHR